jgi:hypothetical protein
MWRATKGAAKAGYPVKVVNLIALSGDPVRLHERCVRLQQEMTEWLNGGPRRLQAHFDGTFDSLLNIYETNPKSSFAKLKPGSRDVYQHYIKVLRAEIGECRIDRTDGAEVETWFDFWAAADKKGKRHVAKARTCIAVLKAAVRFGVKLRHPGCADFREVLRACQFERVPSRDVFATAEQVIAARKAAHEHGHPRAALCYALQFEGVARQWDIKGQWLPISDPKASAVLWKGEKWIGPTWANIDSDMILRWTPTKTEDTTGLETVIDLKECPMVLEEMQSIPLDQRKGPLILNTKTGLPYRDITFGDIWRVVRENAGIPVNVWNRDLRASGTTEARDAGAMIDDLKKVMGHSAKSTTAAIVYDRAKLAAHQRTARARKALRTGQE